jgi:hypothetical protein
MLKIAYMSLLVGMAVSVFVGWKLSLPAKLPELSRWRRQLLLLGLIGNAASLAVFVGAIFHPVEADIGNYRVFFPLTVASIALGAFGRRVPRALVMLNGLVLTFLWLDLAASSL